MGTREQAVRPSLLDLTAVCGKPHVRWCGRADGRNPVSSTRSKLTESIDTTTAQGRLIFHVMGALAEFERALIVERTRAGLAAAKRRGANLGRRRSLTPAQVGHARKLVDAGERPAGVAYTLGVSRATLYRAFGREAQ